MNYMKQFCGILLFSFLGELLKQLLPFPVPASIYGMGLLFAALCLGIIKLEQIKETGLFLVEIMPVLFVAAGVGLMDSWDALKPMLLPVAVILPVTTVLVMVVSGRATQFVMKRSSRQNDGKRDGL